MNISVIIAAAGLGVRFSASDEAAAALGGPSKIEMDVAGRPVFLRAVELFLNRPAVGEVLLAVKPDAVESFRFKHGDKLGFHGVRIIAGGETARWQTVSRALKQVGDACTHVAVHDAARPLTSKGLIDRVFEAAEHWPAVIPGLPVAGTLKRVTEDAEAGAVDRDPLDDILGSAGRADTTARRVTGTVERGDLVEAQTPQVFELNLLRRAYARIDSGAVDADGVTDDAMVVESLGETVHVVEGESGNLKITRSDDLQIVEAMVKASEADRNAGLGPKRLFAHDDDD